MAVQEYVVHILNVPFCISCILVLTLKSVQLKDCKYMFKLLASVYSIFTLPPYPLSLFFFKRNIIRLLSLSVFKHSFCVSISNNDNVQGRPGCGPRGLVSRSNEGPGAAEGHRE